MSPPWKSTQKTVALAQRSQNAAPPGVAVPTFPIPTPSHKIKFGPLRLYASIARCNSLSTADKATLFAQSLAAKAALDALVDDDGTEFCITHKATELGDAKFSSTAHDIGVGIANLYMEDLGYRWVANGKELITGQGNKPDYVYDIGVPKSDLAIMESKGSIGKTVKTSDLKKRTEKAYRKQIRPWLGTQINSRSVGHGYAIGVSAKVGGLNSNIFVEECMWPTIITPSSAPASQPSALVAFSNYGGGFQLAGAPTAARMFRERRRIETDEIVLPDRFPDGRDIFMEFQMLGRRFLAGYEQWNLLNFRNNMLFEILQVGMPSQPIFAVDFHIAQTMLGYLTSPDFVIESRVELPAVSSTDLDRFREDQTIALFGDGLGCFSISRMTEDPKPVRKWSWSARTGLTQM